MTRRQDWRFAGLRTDRNLRTRAVLTAPGGKEWLLDLTRRDVARLCSDAATAMERHALKDEIVQARESAIAEIAGRHEADQ